MARPFLYHIHDSDLFDGKADFESIEKKVPINQSPNPKKLLESKKFYSLKRDLAALRKKGAAKNICDASVTEIGKSLKGRELLAIKLGRNPDHKVLFVGCHHAREWISVELPYYLAEYLIENFDDNPTDDKGRRIKHLLVNREIWIVPMLNADGHTRTHEEDRLWRPNLRELVFDVATKIEVAKNKKRTITVAPGTYTGVDINRNYPTKTWGQETYRPGSDRRATSRDPAEGGSNSIFCGVSLDSSDPAAGPDVEPEPRALTDLMQAQKFKACMSFHSFSQEYIMPNEVKSDPFLQDHADGVKELLGRAEKELNKHYKVSRSEEFLYTTTGDQMDMYAEISPKRPTYTPELRPDQGAPDLTIFSGLPEAEIEPCFQENLRSMLSMINVAPFAEKAKRVTATASDSAPVAQVVGNSWKVFLDWKA